MWNCDDSNYSVANYFKASRVMRKLFFVQKYCTQIQIGWIINKKLSFSQYVFVKQNLTKKAITHLFSCVL